MTIHSADNVDLLRVTVLSLEGILISSLLSADNVVGGCNQHDHQKNSDSVNNSIGNNDLAASSVSSSPYYQHPITLIISAHAGFRTTFPPESVSVSCPQYSTLFPLHDGNLLTVKSKEETVTILDYRNDARDKNKSLVEIVLHWGIDDDEDDEEEVHDAENSNNNDASSNNEETNNEQVSPIITIVVPHLEIMLPSSSTTISNNLSPSSKDEDECDTGAVSEIPPSPTPTIAALPDVIEFHVCVTVTPSTPDDRHAISCVNGNHDCGLDENDTLDKDSFALDEENTQHDHRLPPPPTPPSPPSTTIHHYGIAHLKLPPTELHNANDNESSTTSSLSCGRPGGKVVVLPIRKKDETFTFHSAAPDDEKHEDEKMQQHIQHIQQQHTEAVQFTNDAALFVRVERIRVLNIQHSKKMEQQCHYIESTWEHGHSFAPASIIHHDDENDEGNGKESVEKENKDRDSSWFKMKRSLFASTISNNSPTMRKNNDVMSEHSQMREEIAPTLYQAASMRLEGREQYASHKINRINRRRSTGASAAALAAAATDACRLAPSTTRSTNERHNPLRKSLSLQNIREKILCGASLPSVSETLKLVIEAGQHCDEDHGGLYVVNSNSFGGSTIATAD